MKHLLVVVLVAAILWLVYGFGSRVNFRNIFNLNSPLTISDVSSLLSTLVSGISLFVALWAGSIAVQQLDDAKEGAKEQALILQKQQAALDTSRKALLSVQETALKQQELLNQSLDVSKKQLDVINKQWEDQQRRQSQKPKFEVRCQYTYYVSSKKTRHRLTIEESTGFSGYPSDLFSEKEILHKPFTIKLSNTIPEEKEAYFAGSFRLRINIQNIGDVTAENVIVSVTPLVYGITLKELTGSFEATGATVDTKGELLLVPGIVQKPFLTVFRSTNEQINVNMQVFFLEQEIDHLSTINIGVYSQNAPLHTVPFKFIIVNDFEKPLLQKESSKS